MLSYIEPIWLTLVSVFLVLLETLISAITICLPNWFIEWCTRKVHRMLNVEAFWNDSETRAKLRAMEIPNFTEMCHAFGYHAQEHVVKTQDGYLLSLHRITGSGSGGAASIRSTSTSSGPDHVESGRPVVYLHHGLLMNSEVWVAVTEREQSIAFALSDLGYDVWLGNNRGNKYSKKHSTMSPADRQFWNFSIDEFALYDIPDSISYILDVTQEKSLSYLGFSQGSAQAFAALSIHPDLNRRVNTFIALAPAMAPPGIQPKLIQTFMNASPSLLFGIFGTKIILKTTAFWQNIMEPNLFVMVIDTALTYLFNWRGKNISYPQKLVGYSHLYSFTSVKSVVHWFQIIRAGRLQMYDDDVSSHSWLTRFYQPHLYPTRNITTPIHVIYGEEDSLVDLDALVASVPDATKTYGIKGYEHLDMLWGAAVATEIFPRICEILGATRAPTPGARDEVTSPTSATSATSATSPNQYLRRSSISLAVPLY